MFSIETSLFLLCPKPDILTGNVNYHRNMDPESFHTRIHSHMQSGGGNNRRLYHSKTIIPCELNVTILLYRSCPATMCNACGSAIMMWAKELKQVVMPEICPLKRGRELHNTWDQRSFSYFLCKQEHSVCRPCQPRALYTMRKSGGWKLSNWRQTVWSIRLTKSAPYTNSLLSGCADNCKIRLING